MEDLTKKFYKIGEVSELLDLPLSTLRYWEQEFKELKPRRNDRGTRFYTPADIDLVRRIKYLVHDRGLKIDAAVTALRDAGDTVAARQRALDRLRSIRERLVAMRDALHRLR